MRTKRYVNKFESVGLSLLIGEFLVVIESFQYYQRP
jgi:hypothetical protein